MELYEKAVANTGLYVGKHLTREHVNLTSYSRMNVRLAAQVFTRTHTHIIYHLHHHQVLSKSVADRFKTMRELKVTTTETSETEKFCRIFNKFFDIFNTRSLDEGRIKKNPDLNPFKEEDDPRLKVHFIVIKFEKAHNELAVAERNTFNIFK